MGVVVGTILALAGLAAAGTASSYQRDVEPLLVRYCYDCHGQGSARGDVALDAHASAEARRQRRRAVEPGLGERAQRPDAAARAPAARRRRAGPPGRLDPRRGAGGGLPGARSGPGHHPPAQPRRVQPHASPTCSGSTSARPRTSRADDSGYGFDNIGDVLSVSPVLTEKYFNAAEQVVRRVVAARPGDPAARGPPRGPARRAPSRRRRSRSARAASPSSTPAPTPSR